MGQDPDQIRERIEQTRSAMGETIDAIGYKADVPARAKDKVADSVERARDSWPEQSAPSRTSSAEALRLSRTPLPMAGRFPRARAMPWESRSKTRSGWPSVPSRRGSWSACCCRPRASRTSASARPPTKSRTRCSSRPRGARAWQADRQRRRRKLPQAPPRKAARQHADELRTTAAEHAQASQRIARLRPSHLGQLRPPSKAGRQRGSRIPRCEREEPARNEGGIQAHPRGIPL